MLDQFRQRLNRRLEKLLGNLSPDVAVAASQAELDALRARGNSLIAAGDIVQAEEWFRKALALKADDMDTLVCLGYVLKEQGQYAQARLALRKAIQSAGPRADVYETYYLLGQISELQGDFSDAEKQYGEALHLQPEFTRACKDLCHLYQRQGNMLAVRATLQKCVGQRPELLDYRLWLADVCHDLLDYPGMIEHLSAAVRLGAETGPVCTLLGLAFCRTGEIAQGKQMLARGEALDPGGAYVTQYELGVYYIAAGDLELGLEHLEHCIALKPEFLPAHTSALTALSYARPRAGGDYVRAASRYATVLRSQVTWVSADSATRPAHAGLRIGFVSGDFRRHPVAHFLLDVLKNFDRNGVQLVAYSNNAINDSTTHALRALFEEWHPINHLSDDAAAAMIHEHQIDVLVDLAGHTGDNRLGVFVRRPAPVQVSWLGYWASTGLNEIDYFLADPLSLPEDSTEWFAEQVYRLPHTRLCLSVPTPSRPIPVAEPPCLKNGHITFGSFQQVSKITPHVLGVWAKVLDATPGSRLRLQSRALVASAVRDKLSVEMSNAGIDGARVDLLAGVELEAYFEAHAEVDILLDTFPYPGGTTTVFALWMGVPTITLDGDTLIARQGASMLRCAGLPDWVAATEAEYVDIARKKCANLADLRDLRKGLRGKAEASPLFDARSFASELRAAFIAMSADAKTRP